MILLTLSRSIACMTGSAMESLKQQKKALRTSVKRSLRNFPIHLRHEEDSAIQSRVLSAEWFKESSTLCAYLSCSALREVDTTQIVSNVLDSIGSEKAKELYVPRIIDQQANMSMLNVSKVSDLVPNSMGIVEPDFNDSNGTPRKNVMDIDKPIDLLLIPGLAFDRMGHRLGRGGGYYDVFLQRYLQRVKTKGWRQPLLVALAYSEQVQEIQVPTDETDVPIDAIVLSTGVMLISADAFKRMS